MYGSTTSIERFIVFRSLTKDFRTGNFQLLKILLILPLFVFYFAACSSDEEEKASLVLSLEHQLYTEPLRLEDEVFEQNGQYALKVSRLQYFLSEIELISDNHTYHNRAILLVDAATELSPSFRIEGLEPAHYQRLRFLIGLSPVRNLHDSVRNTVENNAMRWPEAMGGGYHFLKYEGKYRVENDWNGYAVHLGKSGNEIEVEIPIDLHVRESDVQLNLIMRLEEWLQNPHRFDFAADGNYTMDNDSAMQVIAENGKTVFILKE